MIVEDRTPVYPAKVEEAFAANPDARRCWPFVHAGNLHWRACPMRPRWRRSPGVMDCPDDHGLCDVPRRRAGFAGRGDRRGLLSGSQKPPVVPRPVPGELLGRPRWRSRAANACPSWFQDLGLVLGYWAAHHHHIGAGQSAVRPARIPLSSRRRASGRHRRQFTRTARRSGRWAFCCGEQKPTSTTGSTRCGCGASMKQRRRTRLLQEFA